MTRTITVQDLELLGEEFRLEVFDAEMVGGEGWIVGVLQPGGERVTSYFQTETELRGECARWAILLTAWGIRHLVEAEAVELDLGDPEITLEVADIVSDWREGLYDVAEAMMPRRKTLLA